MIDGMCFHVRTYNNNPRAHSSLGRKHYRVVCRGWSTSPTNTEVYTLIATSSRVKKGIIYISYLCSSHNTIPYSGMARIVSSLLFFVILLASANAKEQDQKDKTSSYIDRDEIKRIYGTLNSVAKFSEGSTISSLIYEDTIGCGGVKLAEILNASPGMIFAAKEGIYLLNDLYKFYKEDIPAEEFCPRLVKLIATRVASIICGVSGFALCSSILPSSPSASYVCALAGGSMCSTVVGAILDNYPIC